MDKTNEPRIFYLIRRGSGIMINKKYYVAIILIILCMISALLSDVFFTVSNILNVLRQISTYAITAFGMTLLIISGGIDLSGGGIVALSGVVVGIMLERGYPLSLALSAAALSGLAIGAINGSLIVGIGINPVIITIATQYIARGITMFISAGYVIFWGQHAGYNFIGRGTIGDSFPFPVLLTFFILAIYHLILNNTTFGKHTYAIGGNPAACLFAGVPMKRHRFILYANTGFLAAVSGLILTSRLRAALPSTGIGFEFDVIVASLIGGTNFHGGEGTVISTLIGAFIVGIMRNILNLLGIHAFWQYLSMGLMLIFVILIDSVLKSNRVTNFIR